MPLQLSSLVKASESRWFHFASDGAGGMERVEDGKGVLSLHIDYRSEREIRKLTEANANVKRKALSKRGLKALLRSQDDFTEQLCRATLKDWKLTPRGVHLLNGEFDLTGVAIDEPIEFNEENLDAMLQGSRLATVVYTVHNDHTAFFGAMEYDDEDDEADDENPDHAGELASNASAEGNLKRGPNLNSAKPVAAIASTVI